MLFSPVESYNVSIHSEGKECFVEKLESVGYRLKCLIYFFAFAVRTFVLFHFSLPCFVPCCFMMRGCGILLVSSHISSSCFGPSHLRSSQPKVLSFGFTRFYPSNISSCFRPFPSQIISTYRVIPCLRSEGIKFNVWLVPSHFPLAFVSSALAITQNYGLMLFAVSSFSIFTFAMRVENMAYSVLSYFVPSRLISPQLYSMLSWGLWKLLGIALLGYVICHSLLLRMKQNYKTPFSMLRSVIARQSNCTAKQYGNEQKPFECEHNMIESKRIKLRFSQCPAPF